MGWWVGGGFFDVDGGGSHQKKVTTWSLDLYQTYLYIYIYLYLYIYIYNIHIFVVRNTLNGLPFTGLGSLGGGFVVVLKPRTFTVIERMWFFCHTTGSSRYVKFDRTFGLFFALSDIFDTVFKDPGIITVDWHLQPSPHGTFCKQKLKTETSADLDAVDGRRLANHCSAW